MPKSNWCGVLDHLFKKDGKNEMKVDVLHGFRIA